MAPKMDAVDSLLLQLGVRCLAVQGIFRTLAEDQLRAEWEACLRNDVDTRTAATEQTQRVPTFVGAWHGSTAMLQRK